jgi:hypothetical protein
MESRHGARSTHGFGASGAVGLGRLSVQGVPGRVRLRPVQARQGRAAWQRLLRGVGVGRSAGRRGQARVVAGTAGHATDRERERSSRERQRLGEEEGATCVESWASSGP